MIVRFYALMALVMMFCVGAWAQIAEPVSDEAAFDMVKLIIGAMKQGKYMVASAVLVVILVYLFRKYVLPKIPFGEGILPIVSLLLGGIVGAASSVYMGASWDQAFAAMWSGAFASSLWSAILKYLFKQKLGIGR